jgi:signal transduction histidine kinase
MTKKRFGSVTIQDLITYRFTAVVALLFAVLSAFIYVGRSSYREASFYARLSEKALTVARGLAEYGNPNDPDFEKGIEGPTKMYQEHVSIYHTELGWIYETKHQANSWIQAEHLNELKRSTRLDFTKGDLQISGLAYPTRFGESLLIFVSAKDLYGKRGTISLLRIIAISFLVVVVAAFFVGKRFSRRILHPISTIINQVEHIQIADGSARVDGGTNHDEIQVLAEKFNDLLDRLGANYQAQRGFISNASHELRTPLASMLSQIGVTLKRDRSIPEYQDVLASLKDDVKRISELTDQLFLLAQTETVDAQSRFMSCQIDELVWQARAEVVLANPSYVVSVEFGESVDDWGNRTMLGIPSLMVTAIKNLIENACKYSSPPAAHVRITTGPEIRVEVHDRGIGMSPNDLAHATHAFYRAESAQSVPGLGIGLSLVRSVVGLHRGSFTLRSELGAGTKAEIRVPSIDEP